MHAGSSGESVRRGRNRVSGVRKGCGRTIGDEDATLAATLMLHWTDTDFASAKDLPLDFACLVGANGGWGCDEVSGGEVPWPNGVC